LDKVLIRNSTTAGINNYSLSKRYYFRNYFAFAGFIFLIFFLNGCASKGPISGGAVDDIPPIIIETFPENLSLSVNLDIKVKLKFNERMNRSSVEKAIFISPVPDSKPEFTWNGYKNLTINFKDKLNEEKTYVISIGSGAVDEHKNKIEGGFYLAFSTGDRIDNGTIGGEVYGYDEKSTILLFAYLLKDSVDIEPADIKPDYITQPDNLGEYQFKYLAYGRYRVFAVEDTDENSKYFQGIDRIAVSTKDDAFLTESDSSSTFSFYEFRSIDTLNPVIVSVLPVDNSHLTFRSLEPLVLPEVIDSIWAINNADKDRLVPSLIYPDVEEVNIVHLHFDEMNDDTEYDIYFGALKDSSGNKMDSISLSKSFTSSAEQDTTPPRLFSVTPQRGDKLVYSEDHITVKFNEAVMQESILSALEIFVSDSVSVNYDLVSKYPNSWEAFSAEGWEYGGKYTIIINLGMIRDLKGNSMPDSLWSSKFQVVADDTFGIISGTVIDDFDDKVDIYLTAVPFNKRTRKLNLKVGSNGNFQFGKVFPGKYFLTAYGDTDENGAYSLGSPVPYVVSERSFQGSDTVYVRSRWETADHEIIFSEE